MSISTEICTFFAKPLAKTQDLILILQDEGTPQKLSPWNIFAAKISVEESAVAPPRQSGPQTFQRMPRKSLLWPGLILVLPGPAPPALGAALGCPAGSAGLTQKVYFFAGPGLAGVCRFARLGRYGSILLCLFVGCFVRNKNNRS